MKIHDDKDNSGKFDEFLMRNLKFDEMRVLKAGLFFPYSVIERIKISVETMEKREIKLSEIMLIWSLWVAVVEGLSAGL